MPESPTGRTFLRMFGGMLIGAVVGYVLLDSGSADAVATWRVDEIVSTVLAGLLVMISVITGVGATNPRSFRILTDEGRGEPVETDALSLLRRQAISTGLLGLLLLVPPIAAHAGWTGAAAIAPVLVMAVLLIATGWLHFSLSRASDELSRTVTTESGSASFAAAGLLLFGWAALEKLALVPTVSSWTIMTATLVVSLAVSAVISVRRGLIGR